jgi:BirA family biotin operon repressor/biotin-[acetyl-CoA-carboxylase] ligase
MAETNISYQIGFINKKITMTIGSNIIFHAKLDSTNVLASSMLKTGAPQEGTVITAGVQTAGKGQMGAKWESEEGKNLLASIILYPKNIEAADQFLISMAMSLGVFDFVSNHAEGCKIKWPNDIYVFDDKISGMLIENSVMNNSIVNSIPGIAVNINQEKFPSCMPNPTSLKLVTNSDFDINDCLSEFCQRLDKRYKRLISGAYNEIIDDYNANLYRLNKWCQFRDLQGDFTGRILSVNRSGIITIETGDNKLNEYSFKEISFIK